MPEFRSTKNIFLERCSGSYFDRNWADEALPGPKYPPTMEWSYDREMTIDDVDLWEVCWEKTGPEGSGPVGLYASWCPHAEFYMLIGPHAREGKHGNIKTWYGKGCDEQVKQFLKENNIEFTTYPLDYQSGVKVNRDGIFYNYET
jgi:hypothetical protein